MGPVRSARYLIFLAFALSAAPAWAGEGGGPGPGLPTMATIRTFQLAPGPGVALWDCAGGPNAGCKVVGTVPFGTVVARFETRTEGRPPLSWTRIRGKDIDGWVLDMALEGVGTRKAD